MRRILDYILIGLSLIMLSGCGIKDNLVTVSANTNNIENIEVIDASQFENLNNKIKEVTDNVEAQLEEYIQDKEIEEEIEHLLQIPIPLSYEEISEILEEKLKMADEYGDTVDEVPLKITEEYNKRLKEKEEGIFYIPEEIYSKYMNISDAEIIELINEKQFELHNELRAGLGLPLFERDERLDEIADIRAEEISYFFTHTRPNGEDVFGILSTLGMPSYGENIHVTINYEPNATCKEDYEWIGEHGFESLCNSPGHYANIITKQYTKIGIDTYIIHYDDGAIAFYTAIEFGS